MAQETIDYSGLSPEKMIELLQQKDQIIDESIAVVQSLSLQKDKDGLPVITYNGKNYQALVHSTTLVEGSGIEAEPKVIVVKDLIKSADVEVIENLIQKGSLVLIKD